MTKQTVQAPSLEESVAPHELNCRANNKFVTAISIVPLAATPSSDDKFSSMDRNAEFDARDGKHFSSNNDEHFNSNNNISSESEEQRKAAKVPPRTRILSAAAELFLRYGIAGVSVEAIAKAAATSKPTLYYHFASKNELVAEYLRESAKRLDVCWAEIGPLGSADALVQLGTWLATMADGLVDGWACRLTNAAAELKEKSHPAQRVIRECRACESAVSAASDAAALTRARSENPSKSKTFRLVRCFASTAEFGFPSVADMGSVRAWTVADVLERA